MNTKIKHYHYQGIDQHGRLIKETLYAYNKTEAKKHLLQQHITPLGLYESLGSRLLQKKKTQLNEKNFINHLAQLLSHGHLLVNALTIITKICQNPYQQSTLEKIILALSQGKSLANSLKEHGNFSQTTLSLIAIGEHSSQLHNTLKAIKTHLSQAEKIRQQIKKAIAYPLCIIVVAVAVSVGMMFFVLPQFQQTFSNFNAKLPWITRILIQLSLTLKQTIFKIITYCSITYAILKFTMRRFSILRTYTQIFSWKLPFIGRFLYNCSLQQLFTLLAISISSGMTLIASLELATANLKHPTIRKKLRACIEILNQGSSLHQAFSQQLQLSASTLTIIAIAEQSSDISTALSQLAQQYQQQIDHKINNLNTLLEPAIILLLSIIIGGMVIAMYLPIFEIGNII